MVTALSLLTACGGNPKTTAEAEKIDYTVEQFADLQILRYRVPGFEDLSLKQKELVYYLTEAALQGRDILFDQNGKYNLTIRRMLEAVYTGYKGDKNTPDFKAMEVYLKRVWFSNGIHHHYGSEKFVPGFTPEFFRQAVQSVDAATLPLAEGQTVEQLCEEVFPVIFDPTVMPKRVNQAAGEDLVLTSACNYYDGVTQQEAEDFYNALKNPQDETPVSYGLNSRLVKEDGKMNVSDRQKAYIQINEDAESVFSVIEEFAGVLPFDDHASPEVIKREFGLSKNAFKRAVGHLMKEGKVEIRDKRIYIKK